MSVSIIIILALVFKVLILIILEVTLWVVIHISEDTELVIVLILIILEVTLWVALNKALPQYVRSLNPYYIGSYSMRLWVNNLSSSHSQS